MLLHVYKATRGLLTCHTENSPEPFICWRCLGVWTLMNFGEPTGTGTSGWPFVHVILTVWYCGFTNTFLLVLRKLASRSFCVIPRRPPLPKKQLSKHPTLPVRWYQSRIYYWGNYKCAVCRIIVRWEIPRNFGNTDQQSWRIQGNKLD